MQYSMELGPVMEEENSMCHKNQSEQEKHIMESVTMKLSNQRISVGL
jgi:hypothetical protein